MNKERNEKLAQQLGMPWGTANNRLRKIILFNCIQRLGDDFCFQCGSKIETIDELSIEHKESFYGKDASLFWDLDNIAFSHLSCNTSNRKRKEMHRETTSWCSGCKEFLENVLFSPKSIRDDGRGQYCRNCTSASNAKRKSRAIVGK